MFKTRNLLFIALIICTLTWWAIVPIWHTPDEQAHFAQVSYYAGFGHNPGSGIPDTSQEIYTSEVLLGTERDKFGNNKFTFHPHYNIEYTDSLIGKYEASISALANRKSQTTLIRQEATYYPKYYYVPASWLYNLFLKMNLFTRIYIVRLWSIFLFVINLFFVYKLGQLIFGEKDFKALLLTLLVGFQPMMIFSNIGVTSDSLGNLLFTLFLYCSTRLILKGFKSFDLIFLSITSWFAIVNKIQFIIIIPILFTLFLFLIIRELSGNKRKLFFLILIFAFILFLIYYPYLRFGPLVLIIQSISKINYPSLIKFTLEYTFQHTFHEVMPWYWGVYKWLGATYPQIVYRIINRLVIISVFGFIIFLFKVAYKKLWHDRKIQSILFMLFISLFYFTAISVYDWQSWYTSGYQLAIQGRYFFPLVSFLMIAFILGWQTLIPTWRQLKQKALIFLGILMILFNIYALIFFSSSYYILTPFSKFINQVSQYKPMLIKGDNIVVLLSVYLLTAILLIISLIKMAARDNKAYNKK